MRISDWSSDVCSSDLLHSDLHIQSSLQPINETSNRARLPPPFCPHSLSIESKQLEIFPDAVCETATRVDWLSHTTAPTPEQSQLAADLLVALGYIGALVEPSFKVGCLTIARSRVLQEVKVVGLHAVVKTHIQIGRANV